MFVCMVYFEVAHLALLSSGPCFYTSCCLWAWIWLSFHVHVHPNTAIGKSNRISLRYICQDLNKYTHACTGRGAAEWPGYGAGGGWMLGSLNADKQWMNKGEKRQKSTCQQPRIYVGLLWKRGGNFDFIWLSECEPGESLFVSFSNLESALQLIYGLKYFELRPHFHCLFVHLPWFIVHI